MLPLLILVTWPAYVNLYSDLYSRLYCIWGIQVKFILQKGTEVQMPSSQCTSELHYLLILAVVLQFGQCKRTLQCSTQAICSTEYKRFLSARSLKMDSTALSATTMSCQDVTL